MAQKTRGAIELAEEIALLASPTRIEIVDTLEAIGTPLSVAELAAHMGRPADGLYYHLRQLAAAGLIKEETAAEGKRYHTRSPRGDRLRLRYKPGDTANAQAVKRVASSVLRVAERDFHRAIEDPKTTVDGVRRELWAARGKGWVGRNELAEINQLLSRLNELLLQPRRAETDKLISLSWVLAPIDPKSPRRANDDSRNSRSDKGYLK